MVEKHLRYSPVNGMIIQWGMGAMSFGACGLPKPRKSFQQTIEAEDICCSQDQIIQEINWCDWGKWLPEVGIGIQDFDEEVAAAFVRETAIEFATTTQVLQRSVFVRVEDGVYAYPLEPAENERIVGVLAVLDGNYRMHTGGTHKHGTTAVMRHGTNEVILSPELVRSACTRGCKRNAPILELLVWATPTEEACLHDRILYDQYRKVITAAARTNYIAAMHYDNNALVRTVYPINSFKTECRKIKGQATSWIETSNRRKGVGRLFG